MANNWKYWIGNTPVEWAVGEPLPAGADWQRADFLNQFVDAINERIYLGKLIADDFSATELNAIASSDDIQSTSFWNLLIQTATDCIKSNGGLWLPGKAFPSSSRVLTNPLWGQPGVIVGVTSDCYFRNNAVDTPAAQAILDRMLLLSAGDYIGRDMITALRDVCGIMRIMSYGAPAVHDIYGGTWYQYDGATFGYFGTQNYFACDRTFSGYGTTSATTMRIARVSVARPNTKEMTLRYGLYLTPWTYGDEAWMAWDTTLPIKLEPVATLFGEVVETSGAYTLNRTAGTPAHLPPDFATNTGGAVMRQDYWGDIVIQGDFFYE